MRAWRALDWRKIERIFAMKSILVVRASESGGGVTRPEHHGLRRAQKDGYLWAFVRRVQDGTAHVSRRRGTYWYRLRDFQ